MPVVKLSSSLVESCKQCAAQRDQNRRNSVDYSSDKTSDKGIWSFIGVVGEIALIQYFGLPIDWEYLSTDAGFGGVDVGEFWEVRATTKQSNRLFLWDDETCNQKKLSYAWSKVVVNLEALECDVSGWAMGYEIAEHGKSAQYDCKRGSRFLDNQFLRSHANPHADHSSANLLRLSFLNKQPMESTSSLAPAPQTSSVFSGIQQFEDAQRIAKALASSTLIPPQFQGQQGFANCLVALEIANRMRMSPFQVMQNLHIIHGRPSWSSQFIIGLINGCGRFSPLRYEISGKGDTLACTAVATELNTGEELRGPEVTMAMAKREGWATKSGSKWATMPELMIRYRAAAFWGRLFIPELLVGIHTQEEVMDVEPVSISEAPATSVADLNAKLQGAATDSDELF